MSRPNNGPFEGPPQYPPQNPINQPAQGRGRGQPVMLNQFSQSNFQQALSQTQMQSTNPGQPTFVGQPQFVNQQSGFQQPQQVHPYQQPPPQYSQQQLTQTINPGQPGYVQTGRGLPIQTNVFQTNAQPYQPGTSRYISFIHNFLFKEFIS